jgi:predicted HD phosphohydrolase
MKTVDFTRMEDGTKEEYELLADLEAAEHADFADRVLGWLRSMDTPSGYRITRLQHSLQSATRAQKAGKDEEFVVCCLLHDVGDVLTPFNHSEVAAALLRPYVSEKNYWIVKHHGLFQGYYYLHHFGEDRNARDRYADDEWYRDTVEFCHEFDQNCFDPEYDTLPLETFEPMVRRLFEKTRWATP